MSKRKLLRWLGVCLLVDGIPLLLFGRAYVRLWQVGGVQFPFRRAIMWFGKRPNWLLRTVGMAEAGLGLAALWKAPADVPSLYHLVAGVYDTVAPTWRDGLYHDAHHAFDQILASQLPTGGHVLDLACGTAANLERMLALELPFATYTGVDLSQDMLARARAKFDHLDNVTFARRNLLSDPLPEGPYDLIASTWAFEHLPNPGMVVEKAWSHLRPGGHMALLFEADSGTWRSRAVGWIWRLLSGCRLLQEDEYRLFPGVVSIEHFDGVLGRLALVLLRRPAAPGQ